MKTVCGLERYTWVILLATFALLLSKWPASAQFLPQPSDPSLFDNVIDVPAGSILVDNFTIGSSTQLNLSGGIIGENFGIGVDGGPNNNIEVNINSGNVGQNITANTGTVVNIGGGSFGFRFFANAGSTVNISGGVFGPIFLADSGSEINLFGTDFLLTEVELTTSGFVITETPITGVIGETITINTRSRVGITTSLSGTLADGKAFDFGLSPQISPNIADFFAEDALLTVTLVPEPGAMLTAVILALGGALRRRRRA
ncbi:MAG: hypothetical protein AAGH99_15565 [Planctomycetota bacterium]